MVLLCFLFLSGAGGVGKMHFSDSHRMADTFGAVSHTRVPAWHGCKENSLMGDSEVVTAIEESLFLFWWERNENGTTRSKYEVADKVDVRNQPAKALLQSLHFFRTCLNGKAVLDSCWLLRRWTFHSCQSRINMLSRLLESDIIKIRTADAGRKEGPYYELISLGKVEALLDVSQQKLDGS
jgi:hypothetical protein